MLSKADILISLKSYFQKKPNIKFGYLFGSQCDGTFKDFSDVDIAIFLEDVTFDIQLQVNYELSKLLKKDVDLVLLNNIKNIYLLETIFNEGILIKDDEIRIDFELKKQHEILDFKAFRRMIDVA